MMIVIGEQPRSALITREHVAMSASEQEWFTPREADRPIAVAWPEAGSRLVVRGQALSQAV